MGQVGPGRHEVLGTSCGLIPEGHAAIYFGMGCFWGAERLFWQIPQVHSTCVGYMGGDTQDPSYEEVCRGDTNHAEVVQVVYPRKQSILAHLLQSFWENHDPTQGMRQGNDIGSQYRSVVFTTNSDQLRLAIDSAEKYGERLKLAGKGSLTTQVAEAPEFYFAEGYHQQYLHKNPQGYCGLKGTGIVCALPSNKA